MIVPKIKIQYKSYAFLVHEGKNYIGDNEGNTNTKQGASDSCRIFNSILTCTQMI